MWTDNDNLWRRVMVEENPGVMVAQSRGPRGSERSHFLPLTLPGPWSTLTHCEISDRSCLPSGLGFHSLHSKESGLNGPPRSYPAILTSWWLRTHAVGHHASHHHTLPVSQEGRGLLRNPSPIRQKLWHWGIDSGTYREVLGHLLVSQSVLEWSGLLWAHCLFSCYFMGEAGLCKHRVRTWECSVEQK